MINSLGKKSVASSIEWVLAIMKNSFILLAVQAKQPEGRPKGYGINISQLLAEKASIA